MNIIPDFSKLFGCVCTLEERSVLFDWSLNQSNSVFVARVEQEEVERRQQQVETAFPPDLAVWELAQTQQTRFFILVFQCSMPGA